MAGNHPSFSWARLRALLSLRALLDTAHDVIDGSHEDTKASSLLRREDAAASGGDKYIFNFASCANQFGDNPAAASFFTLFVSPKINEGFLFNIFFHVACHVTPFFTYQ
jgi:hypothetical protein